MKYTVDLTRNKRRKISKDANIKHTVVSLRSLEMASIITAKTKTAQIRTIINSDVSSISERDGFFSQSFSFLEIS